MDCLFCKIIKNEIPSRTIYEDDIVKVILDVNPDAVGHTLVLPKKHYQDINDIDDKTLLHIKEVTQKLMPRYEEKLGSDGITLIQNNGAVQAIKHYHLHIKPHYPTDESIVFGKPTTDKELDEIYEKLK